MWSLAENCEDSIPWEFKFLFWVVLKLTGFLRVCDCSLDFAYITPFTPALCEPERKLISVSYVLGVTYLSQNMPTIPREPIKPITNRFPDHELSPFLGDQPVLPLATIVLKRVGTRTQPTTDRCEPLTEVDDSAATDSEEETSVNPKCMTTEWTDFSACSVTCGVGLKTRWVVISFRQLGSTWETSVPRALGLWLLDPASKPWSCPALTVRSSHKS